VPKGYLLTPQSRGLLEKPTCSELVKKFPAFYGTWRFISTFTSARNLSLSWARSIQYMSPHPTSRRSILILSSHRCLGIPSGLCPSGFPTKTLYTPLISPIHATYRSCRPYSSRFYHPKDAPIIVNEIQHLRIAHYRVQLCSVYVLVQISTIASCTDTTFRYQ